MNAFTLSETAEDLASLAMEHEEMDAAMREANNLEESRGYHDGMGSRPDLRYNNPTNNPAYEEGYEEGKREWLDQCGR